MPTPLKIDITPDNRAPLEKWADDTGLTPPKIVNQLVDLVAKSEQLNQLARDSGINVLKILQQLVEAIDTVDHSTTVTFKQDSTLGDQTGQKRKLPQKPINLRIHL